jgi:hypothetical protein
MYLHAFCKVGKNPSRLSISPVTKLVHLRLKLVGSNLSWPLRDMWALRRSSSCPGQPQCSKCRTARSLRGVRSVLRGSGVSPGSWCASTCRTILWTHRANLRRAAQIQYPNLRVLTSRSKCGCSAKPLDMLGTATLITLQQNIPSTRTD